MNTTNDIYPIEQFEGCKVKYFNILKYTDNQLKKQDFEKLIVDLNKLSNLPIGFDMLYEVITFIKKCEESIKEINSKERKNKENDKEIGR